MVAKQYAKLTFLNVDKNHVAIYLETPSQSLETPPNFRLIGKFYTNRWFLLKIDGGKYKSKRVSKKKSCAEATLEYLYKLMPQVRKFNNVDTFQHSHNSIEIVLSP